MSPNRRILLNTFATAARSIFSMFVGLFSSRWVLSALGVESYGVYGVIGVITSGVMFFNNVLSTSISRFFAFAIGEYDTIKSKELGMQHQKEWFNVAFFIHFTISIILVTIGLPIGLFLIKRYFAIPLGLVDTTAKIFVLSMISAFVCMISAPFRGLFIARQYISELTIYEFTASILNALFAYSLLNYTGNKLLYHGFYTMIVVVLPLCLIIGRSFFVFPECSIHPSLMFMKDKIIRVFSFAGWLVVSWSGGLLRTQGISVMVNRLLGLEYNSTLMVSGNITGHAAMLSNALNGALVPAMSSAAGSKDSMRLSILMISSCKYGALLVSLFVCPLIVEIEYVISLWLEVAPPGVCVVSVLALISLVINRSVAGIATAIFARGQIKKHELFSCLLLLLTLLYAVIIWKCFSLGILGFAIALLMGNCSVEIMRLFLWKNEFKQDLNGWFNGFFVPFCLVFIAGISIGIIPKIFLSPSLARLSLVTLVSVSVIILGGWYIVLTRGEQAKISLQILNIKKRLF